MKVLHSICTIFAPMKARNILILILGTLILPIYLTSCGVDRWKEYADRPRQTAGLTIPCVCVLLGRRYPPYQRLELFSSPFHFLCLAQIRRRQILHHRQSGQHHHYPQHPLYGLQLRIPVHYQPDRSRRRRECHCCTDSLRCRRKPGLGNRAKTG